MRSEWIFLFLGTSLFALPQDPLIVSGTASMTITSSEVMEIMAQDGSVIEWRDFSIDTSETTRFSQPSAEALVLNRVVGSEMSQILGKLEANGRVLLINPNGILFGKEARIDTGSFVASTLDLQNDLFAKNKIFKGASTAQIIHLGSITARDIALIAADINQQGSLNAAAVALIGSTYTQDFECQFPDENGSRITHSGRIDSPGGRVHLMAGEIYVFGTSEIATSSPYNGGEILVGAGQQGKDSAFTNAQLIWVEENSRFLADSWEQGNGGRVILFSDRMTEFAGSISAQGGKWGGDGGFAEVSGGYLAYKGLTDLRSPLEKNGTLLLDPTNITVVPGAVDVNLTTTGGFSFPLTCGGISPVSTQYTTTVPFIASQLSITTLSAQVALTHVIIDSTTIGAGLGHITFSAGADLDATSPTPYATANDLILRAPATGIVTINSNVQNSGTGRIIIDSLGLLVDIVSPPPGDDISFGSNDGLTQICAPNATVNVNVGAGGGFCQVGFRTPSGGTSTGPISITCDYLNVFSLNTPAMAQIGHGRIKLFPASDVAVTNTTPSATITVNALHDITVESILPGNAVTPAKIGHGSIIGLAAAPAPASSLAGDITLTSSLGSLFMQELVPLGSSVFVGHGFIGGGTAASIAGDIHIFVPNPNGGDVQMVWDINNSGAHIGHHLPGTLTTLDGDIEVCCGRDLIMSGNGGLETMNIAHTITALGMTYTGTTRIAVANDFLITSANVGMGFGGGYFVGCNVGGPVNQSTQIVVGRDFRANINGTGLLVGSNVAGSTSTLFMAVGRDIILNSVVGGIVLTANDRVAISAGQDFRATAGAASIGVAIRNDVPVGTTCIHAGRDLIGTNSVTAGVNLGKAIVSSNYFVDFRAGRNIQIPNDIDNAETGSIFIEADSNFTAGQLWSYSGGTIATICGFPLAYGPFVPFPIPCISLLAGRGTGDTSPAIPLDCFGAVRFDFQSTLGTFPLLQTTTGNITIHSGSQTALSIGFGAGDTLRLLTTSGNIEIFGTVIPGQCERCDAFQNVIIDQAITTIGTVLICANNDLILTASGSIDTSGGPSAVTLICDNQAPVRPLIGPGRFIMDSAAFINTGGAPLQIYTALQGANIWGLGARLNNLAFGTDWTLGTLYVDTNQEIWCTYYCTPIDLGSPFRISYKDCLQQVTEQATVIVTEALVNLHPYNEFPGWMMRFWMDYALDQTEYPVAGVAEPYMLRRRHLNVVNHPKTWAQLVEDTHPRPTAN